MVFSNVGYKSHRFHVRKDDLGSQAIKRMIIIISRSHPSPHLTISLKNSVKGTKRCQPGRKSPARALQARLGALIPIMNETVQVFLAQGVGERTCFRSRLGRPAQPSAGRPWSPPTFFSHLVRPVGVQLGKYVYPNLRRQIGALNAADYRIVSLHCLCRQYGTQHCLCSASALSDRASSSRKLIAQAHRVLQTDLGREGVLDRERNRGRGERRERERREEREER